ncbi:MAG: DRTGG domain-containing protein [Clostridia bacterium]|nr:DRTGG domain-containing protein [Clostridia bacterium]
MTVQEIAVMLDAVWLCCEEEAQREIHSAFASDMMSDVLAYVKEDTLLLTGLVNSQSVRTCEMLDVPCVVFVRDKEPQPDAIEMAVEIGLPALKTPYTMYEVCGRLYAAGLPPVRLV